jgi:hypothetical protein
MVENHMKNELDLMQMSLRLTKEDASEFLKWYYSHNYTKGIQELVGNVERRRTTDANIGT